MRRRAKIWVLCGALLGCSEPAPTATGMDAAVDAPPAPALAPAEAKLRRVLAGERALRAEAIEDLRAVTEAEPANGRAFLLYGMGQLSALAEERNLRYLGTTEPALRRARELLPEDRRIDGWLALLHVQLASVGGDPAAVQRALDELRAAADAYPAFNTFDFMLASPLFPVDSGVPRECLRRADGIARCGETDARCRNSAIAPHNEEGALVTYGDLHARLGERDEALRFYRAALATDASVGWSQRAVVQGYVDGIDLRVRGLLEGGPSAPPFFAAGPASCVGCHGP